MTRHIQPSASENGFGEECAGKVRHLLGHYYICTVQLRSAWIVANPEMSLASENVRFS
jgi:hypothetical protein